LFVHLYAGAGAFITARLEAGGKNFYNEENP
jgi:hypothetical protein